MSFRHRSSALSILETFRNKAGISNLQHIVAFLYICENEGLCISELRHISGLSQAGASRSVDFLMRERDGVPPDNAALIRTERAGKLKSLRLTEAGTALRERIDLHIMRSTPIAAGW